jgi:2-polyprenyl-3-methyl-5-hydroxy-6-metoxy-1,4-benzoquinol methylase
MKYSNCPLCNGVSTFIERINTDQLAEIYQKYLSIDISHQFKDVKFIDFMQCSKCGLKFINPLITGDDYFYQLLEAKENYYPLGNKTEFTFAKKLIKKQDKVLDIGAGRGVFGKCIDCSYYQGIDFSSKAIELAESDGVNVKAIPIQKHCIDKEAFYDVVVLFQIIEHIGIDINDFLASSIKCLKKGGKLIVAVPDNDGYLQYVENLCLNLPPHHTLFWNEKSLRTLAVKFDLEIDTIIREPVLAAYQWYATMVNKNINKLLGMKVKRVNVSLWSKYSRLFYHLAARVLKYTNVHKNSTGLFMIIVYRKKQ